MKRSILQEKEIELLESQGYKEVECWPYANKVFLVNEGSVRVVTKKGDRRVLTNKEKECIGIYLS